MLKLRNLEFKARVDDLAAIQRRARDIGADLWGDLRQTDTYFPTPGGRLKLRETPGRQAELIFYMRDEQAGHRPSDYDVAFTADVEAMRNVLSRSLGVLAVVRKRRTLLILDTARIHLDNVDGLGNFLEIEQPVKEADSEPAAKAALDRLIESLGLSWPDCVRASYLDLVLGRTGET